MSFPIRSSPRHGLDHLATLLQADDAPGPFKALLPDGLDQLPQRTYRKSAILTVVNMAESCDMA
jgi:hypothetical protein